MWIAVGGYLLGRAQRAPPGLRRKPIVCTDLTLLIHRERSPFPAGEGLGCAAILNVGRGFTPADLQESYFSFKRVTTPVRLTLPPSSVEEGCCKVMFCGWPWGFHLEGAQSAPIQG